MRTRSIQRLFGCWCFAVGWGVLLSVGCGPGYDEKSGGDNRIATARTIELGEPATDRISNRIRDNVDWKLFVFDDVRGRIRVDLYWDEPDAELAVNLRDQFGALVFGWKHRKGQQHESYADIRVREGRYYLEIRCAAGDTVYTVEVVDMAAEAHGDPGGASRPE